jgi:hypothetical protein
VEPLIKNKADYSPTKTRTGWCRHMDFVTSVFGKVAQKTPFLTKLNNFNKWRVCWNISYSNKMLCEYISTTIHILVIII